MTLTGEGGRDFVIGRLDDGSCPLIAADVIALAEPMMFDRCPICLAPDPNDREHVPPESVGGSVMTWTCSRCNNRLGSVVESALVDWWEDAICSVRFSHDEVRGARKTSRILLRRNESDEGWRREVVSR